ncbi:hypothetical protein BGZ80_001240 [Entomortierella chlamydospora]|uniref:Uncharacterized protein n=1 Tax=Entomortierella chlamydospora TaxID=101097 RepID=A0A9P6T3Z6_9FUNG|nr:hypothetical protein BGZ80_001240 [Entomortierella chlamydospora]
MNSTLTVQPNDNDATGATRRRSATLTDPFSVRIEEDMQSTGRQTPDAAPAYSATSPLGPLSPAIVDAISSASIEYRQSLAMSILSSTQSLSYHPDSPSIGVRAGTAQSSVVSSIDEFAPIHLLGSSPRSSVTSDWPLEDAGETEVTEASSSTGVSNDPNGLLARPIEPNPPTYDPAWRSSLPLSQRLHTRDRIRSIQSYSDQTSPRLFVGREASQSLELHQGSRRGQLPGQISRLMQDQEPGQHHNRNEHLHASTSHRRTESFNSSRGVQGRRPPAHRRGLTMNTNLSTSRRTLSWTGNMIAFNPSRSRTSSHASHDLPSQRTHLFSSWSPPPETTVPVNHGRDSASEEG